jgi:hypothetical protein
MGEQRGSRGTKSALAREQSGGTLVSDRSRVTLSSGKLYNYILRELGASKYKLSLGLQNRNQAPVYRVSPKPTFHMFCRKGAVIHEDFLSGPSPDIFKGVRLNVLDSGELLKPRLDHVFYPP